MSATSATLTNKPYRRSSVYYKQATLGATFVQDDIGWVIADHFKNTDDEQRAAQNGVGVADISSIGKLNLKDPELNLILRKWYPDIKDARTGSVLIGNDAKENSLCLILASDEALMLIDEHRIESVKERLGFNSDSVSNSRLVDVSSVLAGLSILGPKSREVVSKICDLDVNEEDFQNLTVSQCPLLHVQGIVLRMDLNGMLAYQFFFERSFGEYLWDAVMNAGNEFKIAPVGKSALNALGWSWS